MARRGKASKKHPNRTKANRGIQVEVPGVESTTVLTQLTVEQFVLLLGQVLPQIEQRRRRVDAVELKDVISRVRKTIESGSQTTAIRQGVRDAQLAILDKLPEVIREIES